MADMADPTSCPVCLPALPSGTSAYRVVHGDWGALPEATLHMVARGALIGLGLYAAGARGKTLLSYSLAGAGAVEVFVVGWALWKDHAAA